MAVVLPLAASLGDATAEADGDYGYATFYDDVGALVMGRRTYEQIRGFGA